MVQVVIFCSTCAAVPYKSAIITYQCLIRFSTNKFSLLWLDNELHITTTGKKCLQRKYHFIVLNLLFSFSSFGQNCTEDTFASYQLRTCNDFFLEAKDEIQEQESLNKPFDHKSLSKTKVCISHQDATAKRTLLKPQEEGQRQIKDELFQPLGGKDDLTPGSKQNYECLALRPCCEVADVHISNKDLNEKIPSLGTSKNIIKGSCSITPPKNDYIQEIATYASDHDRQAECVPLLVNIAAPPRVKKWDSSLPPPQMTLPFKPPRKKGSIIEEQQDYRANIDADLMTLGCGPALTTETSMDLFKASEPLQNIEPCQAATNGNLQHIASEEQISENHSEETGLLAELVYSKDADQTCFDPEEVLTESEGPLMVQIASSVTSTETSNIYKAELQQEQECIDQTTSSIIKKIRSSKRSRQSLSLQSECAGEIKATKDTQETKLIPMPRFRKRLTGCLLDEYSPTNRTPQNFSELEIPAARQDSTWSISSSTDPPIVVSKSEVTDNVRLRRSRLSTESKSQEKDSDTSQENTSSSGLPVPKPRSKKRFSGSFPNKVTIPCESKKVAVLECGETNQLNEKSALPVPSPQAKKLCAIDKDDTLLVENRISVKSSYKYVEGTFLNSKDAHEPTMDPSMIPELSQEVEPIKHFPDEQIDDSHAVPVPTSRDNRQHLGNYKDIEQKPAFPQEEQRDEELDDCFLSVDLAAQSVEDDR